MQFEITTRVLAPATSLNDPSRRFPRLNDVVYAYASATRHPSYHGYTEMIEAAHTKIAYFIRNLEEIGYRPYIFIVGAALTANMIESIPHYDLWAKAQRLGMTPRRTLSTDLFSNGRRRRLGIYEIRAEDLLTACQYQSLANACVIALSRTQTFFSKATLSRLYEAAQPDEADRIIDLRWYDFIEILCGADHVLLQEHGLFDDLERSLTLCMATSTWAAIS